MRSYFIHRDTHNQLRDAVKNLYLALLKAQSAAELAPKNGKYQLLLGEITYRLRDDPLYRAMSIKALTGAIKMKAGAGSGPLNQLAKLHALDRNWKQAVNVYGLLLQYYPHDVVQGQLNAINNVCIEAHLSRLCIDHYKKAAATLPKGARESILLAKAVLHRYQKETKTALVLLTNVERNSNNPGLKKMASQLSLAWGGMK